MTLRHIASFHNHSGRMSLSMPKTFPRPFGWDVIAPNLSCLPGEWNVFNRQSLISRVSGADLVIDRILIIHSQEDPSKFDFRSNEYSHLRLLGSTGRLIMFDSYCQQIRVGIPLSRGIWSLHGELWNSTKIHVNDYENRFFLLRAESDIASRIYTRLRSAHGVIAF